MAKDDFKQRIVVEQKPPSPAFIPIPDVPNADSIAVAPRDAELSGLDIPDGGATSTAIRAVPDAGISIDIPDAPNLDIPAQATQANLSTDVPDAGIYSIIQTPSRSPELSPDIPDTSNASVIAPAIAPAQLPPDIPDTQNASVVSVFPRIAELSADIADTQNASVVVRGIPAPNINIDIPDTQSTVVVVRDTPPPSLGMDIPDAGNDVRIQKPQPTHDLSADIPDAPALARIQTPTKSPEIGVDIPDAPALTRVQTPRPSPDLPLDIPDPGEISQEHRREFSFGKGEWMPDDDPLNIGPDDYATQQNFRYIDGGIEGVGGFDYINTSPLGKQIRSGIQLKTNYSAQSSVIVVQGMDSDETDGILATNESTIPGTLNFGTSVFTITASSNDTIMFYSIIFGVESSHGIIVLTPATYGTGSDLAYALQTKMNDAIWLTQGFGSIYTVSYSSTTKKFTITTTTGTITYTQTGSTLGSTIGFSANKGPLSTLTSDTAVSNDNTLYIEESGATLARFSRLQQGNIGMCDGKTNKIYAGDEAPVGAFLYGAEKTVLIGGSSDNIEFTSGTGTATITITGGTYTGTTLAAEIQTKIRAAALSLPAALCEFRVGKFWFDAGIGKTILFSGTGDGALTIGLTQSTSAARTMLSQAPWVASPHFEDLRDETKIINNSLTSTGNTVTIASATTYNYFLVGSTRPITGLKITTTSGNFTTATLSGTYFNGEKFASLSSLAVSTSGSVDTVTFTDTSDTARPIFIDGYYLFFYRFELSAGSSSVTISNVTCNSGIQDVVDVWDGNFRTATKFIFKKYANSKYSDFDFTLEAQDNSSVTTREYAYDSSATETKTGLIPIGVDVNGSGKGLNGADEDYIEVMFSEPMCAFKWDLYKTEYGGDVESMTVSFWDGDSYTQAQNVYDTLKNDEGGTANYYMLERGGVQFFEIPLYNADMTAYTTIEKASEINGVKGYRYKISWTYQSDKHRFLHLILDRFSGIPRFRTITNAYTFPFQYQRRALWCGSISDGEYNRVDYSVTNAPDVYNGDDSSRYDNSQSLYFGGKEKLTGAAELFNQYGLNLASGALFYKNAETFLLTGSTPTGDDAFKIHKISGQIGCPSPLTITPAEVSFTTGNQPPANIVLWLSDKGPMMYYNASIYYIPGVNSFFDPKRTDICINTAYLDRAAAWYDPQYREWNLVFPSVAGGTALCDTWLVYDLVRRKWWRRVTANTADFPQGGFIVEDTTGNKYVYCYTASGYLLRMEYHASGLYDGTTSYGITNTLKSADILPNQSMWDRTVVPAMKVLYVDNAEGSLAIDYYADGVTTATSAVQAATSMNGSNRYVNLIKRVYDTTSSVNHLVSGLSHAFQFAVTGAVTTKPRLLGWGFQYLFDRGDDIPS